jgi:dipeptidyl aminopeptidase/acylaminoacyl peptidase
MDRRLPAIACLFLCAQLAAAEMPPAYEELYKPAQYRAYSFSPSGRYLFEIRLLRHGGEPLADLEQALAPGQALVVRDLARGTQQQLRTGRPEAAIWAPRWISDTEILWQAGVPGTGRFYVERVRLRVGADGALQIVDILSESRDSALLGERMVPERRLLLGLDVEEGESLALVDPTQRLQPQIAPDKRLLAPLRWVANWAVDGKGVLRGVEVVRRRGDTRILVPATGGGWREVYRLALDPYITTDLVDVDDASGALLVITDDGTDRRVLRELDPATGKLGRVRLGDATNNVSAATRDADTGRVDGVVINDNLVRIEFLDPRVREVERQVRALLRVPTARVIATSRDLRQAVAFVGSAADPGEYHRVDLGTRRTEPLGALLPGLRGAKLGASRPITLKARDGLTLHGQFTAPTTKRFARQPLVVMPHGGPFGIRDYAYFDPEVQTLATRGYAVLQVDFRGSGGYGRDFLKAGFKRWGREMQTDLADATRWAIAQGLADPARVCIVGSSYGGYSAVMGLIQEPDLYRCGASVAGVSDLSLLFRSDEVKSNRELRNWMADAIGDPVKEADRLKSHSPAYLAGNLRRPLFIAHGGKDTRAEPEHAHRLRAAVEAGGGKVDWLYLAEEGHGFREPASLKLLAERLDAFLAAHLGDGP